MVYSDSDIDISSLCHYDETFAQCAIKASTSPHESWCKGKQECIHWKDVILLICAWCPLSLYFLALQACILFNLAWLHSFVMCMLQRGTYLTPPVKDTSYWPWRGETVRY